MPFVKCSVGGCNQNLQPLLKPDSRGWGSSLRRLPAGLSFLVDHVVPPYGALMESYNKTQGVQKSGRETKLDRLEAAPVKKGAPASA
jgi:hypothetical protein